jgi:hypothetical protein
MAIGNGGKEEPGAYRASQPKTEETDPRINGGHLLESENLICLPCKFVEVIHPTDGATA